jgi:uncharacterized sulfatase
MYAVKPFEILYDLENDPLEQNNLASLPQMKNLVDQLSGELDEWMIRHRDTGLLTEGIMMQQAGQSMSSVYETSRAYTTESFQEVLSVAKLVGKITDLSSAISYLDSDLEAVRFWGLIGIDAYKENIDEVKPKITALLSDESPAVAIKAAEILIKREDNEAAYEVLRNMLSLEDEVQVLQAAISVRQLGAKAEPLISTIKEEIFPKYSGEIWGRYKSWSYPMFIGMALDQAQINCGIDVPTRK